jgi:hypothetical protein
MSGQADLLARNSPGPKYAELAAVSGGWWGGILVCVGGVRVGVGGGVGWGKVRGGPSNDGTLMCIPTSFFVMHHVSDCCCCCRAALTPKP